MSGLARIASCKNNFLCTLIHVLLITIQNSHLQLTITNVLLESFPQKLLASHLYFPASLLLTLISERMFPSVRSPVLTSVQDTDGKGIPLTWQAKVLFLPSITVVLISTCITGASTSKRIYRDDYIWGSSFLCPVDITLNKVRCILPANDKEQ